MTLPSLQGNNGKNVGAAGLHGFYQVGELAGEATSPAFLKESGARIKKFKVAQYAIKNKRASQQRFGKGWI